MEILTSSTQLSRLNSYPQQLPPEAVGTAGGSQASNGRISLITTTIDEQSSQKTSGRRQLLEQERAEPLSIIVKNITPEPLQRQNLPGLPQLGHGVSSSAFLAQQISQLEHQQEAQDALHEAASNAYDVTLQRSAIVMGFQGGSGFYA